jgi:hypothetical protein
MQKLIQTGTILLTSLFIAGFSVSCDKDSTNDDNSIVGEWYNGGRSCEVHTGNAEYDKIIEDRHFDPGDTSQTVAIIFNSDGTGATSDGKTGTYSQDGNMLTIDGETYILSSDKKTISTVPEDWTSIAQGNVSQGAYPGVPTETVVRSATRTYHLKKK